MQNNKSSPGSEKISIEQFKQVDMRVGEIKEAERVEETDTLLHLLVDMGEESSRQVISGIAEHFPDPQTLIGKRCIFVANLIPRKIRGLLSDGMIVAAYDENNTFTLVVPETSVPVGTRLG